MKTNYFKLLTLLMVIVALIGSCKKDETKPDDENPQIEKKNNYLASGSYGDVITYSIDENNNTYSYTNETTGQSDSGTFTTSSNTNLTGVYEVSIGGENFYAVELAEKVFATSLPSGRAENKLCFGISADLDLSTNYSMADLSGKYIFIVYDDNHSGSHWGGYDLKSDGTYTWNYGPDDETTFDEATHFAGGGSGTWVLSSSNSSRVIFTEGGIDYEGTIYPGKAMLVDNGVGGGFSIGIKYPDTHTTQSSIAGTYKYLDIIVNTSNPETGVGYYTLPATGGDVNYYYKYNGSSGEGSGNCYDFAPVSQVNNMFKTLADYGGIVYTTWFIILPGEVMLYFSASPTELVSYGIGAKIN